MHGQIKVSKVIFFLCISFRNFYKIFKKFFALFEHLDNNIFLEINIIIVPHLRMISLTHFLKTKNFLHRLHF